MGVGDKWANHSGNVDLDFADEVSVAAGKSAATAECLTIPASADQKYTVTFLIDIYYGDVLAATNITKTATIEGVALQMGKAYNFTTTLDHTNATNDVLYPITFGEPQVLDWNNVEENFVTPIPVASAAELVEAVAAGNNVMLTANIDLDAVATTAMAGTRAAAAGIVLNNDIVIDGNGFTISTTAVRAIQIIGAKNVTIKNLTLNAGGERGIQMQDADHNVVLENVKAVSNNYTLHITDTATNPVVTVTDCDLKGLNTVNVWGENAKVTLNNTKVTCEDNNTKEGYAPFYAEGPNAEVIVNGGEVVICGTACDDTFAGVTFNNSTITFNGTKGDCIVKGHSFAINYGEYRYSFATFAKALEEANAGETIYLTNDVTETITVDVDKAFTLDLNGKNITCEGDGIVVNKGELTIVGNGVVTAASTNTEPWCAVWVYGTGKVNINGGEYKAGYPEGDYNDLIYAKDDAVINISAGKFYNSGKENAFVLNLKDGSNATIKVTGGEYEKFDPSVNKSESPQRDFVAAGYKVEKNGDWYKVVAE